MPKFAKTWPSPYLEWRGRGRRRRRAASSVGQKRRSFLAKSLGVQKVAKSKVQRWALTRSRRRTWSRCRRRERERCGAGGACVRSLQHSQPNWSRRWGMSGSRRARAAGRPEPQQLRRGERRERPRRRFFCTQRDAPSDELHFSLIFIARQLVPTADFLIGPPSPLLFGPIDGSEVRVREKKMCKQWGWI